MRARGITVGDIRTGAADIMAADSTDAGLLAAVSKDEAAVSMVKIVSAVEAAGMVAEAGTAAAAVGTANGPALGELTRPTAQLPAVFLWESLSRVPHPNVALFATGVPNTPGFGVMGWRTLGWGSS